MIAKQALSHSQHIGESSDHLNDLGSNHLAAEAVDGIKRDWVPSTQLVAIKEEQKSSKSTTTYYKINSKSEVLLKTPGTMAQELFWCRVALVNSLS